MDFIKNTTSNHAGICYLNLGFNMYVFAKSSDHPLTETVLKKQYPTAADKPPEKDKK